LVPRGQKDMENLGVFGGEIAQDAESFWFSTNGLDQARFAGGRNRLMLGAMAKAPVPAAPMSRSAALDASSTLAEAAKEAPGGAPPSAGELAQPIIRSEFADTAFWSAALETNKDGIADAELDMPQNLTAWKIRAWSMGQGTRVGEAAAQVVTRKNLIVRMQAPRFFVERDEVVLSANIHNYLPTAKQVKARLELDGKTLELPAEAEQSIEIPAGGERRVDWRVKAVHEGEAVIRMLG